jgi:hypothetical protein
MRASGDSEINHSGNGSTLCQRGAEYRVKAVLPSQEEALLMLDNKKVVMVQGASPTNCKKRFCQMHWKGGQISLKTYDEGMSLLKSDQGKMNLVCLEQASFEPSSRKDVVEGHGDDGLEGQVLLKGMEIDSTKIDVVDHGLRNSDPCVLTDLATQQKFFNKGEFDLKNDAKKKGVKVYKKNVNKKVDRRDDVVSK